MDGSRFRCRAGLAWALLPAPARAAAPDGAPAMHAFVDRLMRGMTLEEKIGQLTIIGSGRPQPGLEKRIRGGRVGGVNGVLLPTPNEPCPSNSFIVWGERGVRGRHYASR